MQKLTVLEKQAIDLCEWAVGAPAGVCPEDGRYREVVEDRDRGPYYSSCADLAHWLLFRLGCREPWINRAEHRGWQVGVNVNALFARPVGRCPSAVSVRRANRDAVFAALRPGDVLISWPDNRPNSAHVCVYGGSPSLDVITTYDYGQGPMGVAAWKNGATHVEGCKRERTPWIVKRDLRSALKLSGVPMTAEAETRGAP